MDECPYGCPFCTGISVLKSMNPEVTTHLSSAGKEFMLAVQAFIEALGEQANKTGSEAPLEKVWLESDL